MRANPEQMQALGTLCARCQLAQMTGDDDAEAALAGLVAAASVLLPRAQWDALCAQGDLDGTRLRRLARLFPNPERERETIEA